MSISRNKGMFAVLVVVLIVVGSLAASASEMTRIQFVLDASLSMMSRIQGESRMEIAKDVMRDLLLDLEDRPDLEIALRVYGSGLTDLFGCRDSVLFQDFAPVREAREPILALVESLEPRGVTPIAYSLTLAGEDFAAYPDGQNVIVLITDGQESCQGDPCAVSRDLQQQGVVLKPFVVGFALPEREAEFVRCIGHYYEADDRETLKAALNDILAAITQGPVLDLAVWAQEQAITDQVRVRVVDASGQETDISHLVTTSPWARVPGLAAGEYTVVAAMDLGPETVTASSAPFVLTSGEATAVELDFGPLTGTLTVVARAGGVDVTEDVEVSLTQGGVTVETQWRGTPLQAVLPAGLYDIAAVLSSDPSRRAEATSWVAVNADTWVELELGQLPAQLLVDVLYLGQDISSAVSIDVYRDGRWQHSWAGGEPGPLPPGHVDLRVRHDGHVVIEKTVADVELPAGEMTHLVLDMGRVMGTLQIALEADGSDVTASGTAQVSGTKLTGEPFSLQLPQQDAVKEAVLPAGSVVAVGSYGGSHSEPADLTVTAGEITQAVLQIPTQGQVRLVPRIDGTMAPVDQIEAHLWQQDRYIAQLAPRDTGLVLTVPPGDYRLEALYLTAPVQEGVVDSLTVHSGEETVVEVAFAGTGSIEVAALTGDSPFAHVQYVEVRQGEEAVMRLSREHRDSHLWHGELLAGVYDLRVVSIGALRLDDVWLYGVEVRGGETATAAAQLPGIGRIELQVFMEGELYDGAAAPRVYQAGSDSSLAQLYREGDRADALWSRDFAVGTYDISVDPTIRGMEAQWLRDVEVFHDETTQVEVHFGASGFLQIQVLADGEPFSDVSAPRVYVAGETRQLAQLHRVGPRDDGVWSRELPAGHYDVRVSSNVRGMEDIIVRDVPVRPGITEEITVEFASTGMLQLLVLADGEPFGDISAPRVFVQGETRQLAQLHRVGARDAGLWEREFPAGQYDLRVNSNVRGMEDILLEGIVVPSGGVVKVTAEFPGSGTLQVQVLRNGQPLPEIRRINAYPQGESNAVAQLTRAGGRSESIWERDLVAGTYDVEIITQDHGTHWLRGVVVRSRQLTALTADVD